MNLEKSSIAASDRIFGQSDQESFAELSGDWNPIHMDPVQARRTPYGQIVHGIHALAWALDRHLAPGGSLPSRIRVAFLKPIGLGAGVSLAWSRENGDDLCLLQHKDRTLASIRLTPGTSRFDAACLPAPGRSARAPEALEFAALRGRKGSLEAQGDAAALARSFPNLAGTAGTLRTAALLALSRLVGMECPGLNSIFSGLEVRFREDSDPAVGYEVVRHSIPNAPLRVAFAGGGIEGTLDAFYRPAPARQIGMADLRGLVEPDEFRGQVALVVGGSRGLGESLAKILAAGGGEPIVSYNVGHQDARRVAAEISGGGGACRTLRLDALSPEADLRSLADSGPRPTHLYYFASPPIRINKGAALDRSQLDAFLSYYVEGFERVCRALCAGGPLRAFYPSTVFLDGPASGFTEYVCAKAAGEALCRQLARDLPGFACAIERLPRMHTDQTNSILEARAADPHGAMLAVARKMHTLEAEIWARSPTT